MQYYESPAYSAWCKRVYGNDLKQMGMVTMEELELFFREAAVPPGSQILDIGCGPGYLSAAVAARFGSQVTGIDIDEGAIAHAKKTFPNQEMLSFAVADGNQVSYGAQSFDLIYLFDTLYFTGTVEKLRALLDKCLMMLKPGGVLAVFWSNHPNLYKLREPTAGGTQVGIWGVDNAVPFKAFDLTESTRKFWMRAQAELMALAPELRAQIPETYETIAEECSRFSQWCAEGNAGGMYRWMYVFTKD